MEKHEEILKKNWTIANSLFETGQEDLDDLLVIDGRPFNEADLDATIPLLRTTSMAPSRLDSRVDWERYKSNNGLLTVEAKKMHLLNIVTMEIGLLWVKNSNKSTLKICNDLYSVAWGFQKSIIIAQGHSGLLGGSVI